MRLVHASEFACPCEACNHSNFIDLGLVDRLDYCRKQAGIPFVINSGYRCEWHNQSIPGSSPSSAHLLGLAADIDAPTSGQKFKILDALIRAGFNRCGIYSRFIHVDQSTTHPQDVIWHG